MKQEEITLIGSGLAGSLLAILLAQRGHVVDVYDKRPDPRSNEAEGGRSINLALSHRGWCALEKAHLADKIRASAIPMKGRMMHDVEGTLTFQPYGKEGQMIYSISRSELNRVLVEAADTHPNVNFHFNTTCQKIDLPRARASFKNAEGTAQSVQSTLLIGADGAFSRVRAAMQKTDRFNYSQHYIPHGYKELTIPPTENGDFRLEPNALHIWPRKRFMLIALPNQDRSFTATLFFPFEGEVSFEALQTPKQVHDFFAETFPDTLPLIPNLETEFFENPTSSLVTVRCSPWVYQHHAMLIGDAAHAIVPFYGQGMNAAFEDCRVFDDLLEQYGNDWATILPEYQRLRVANGSAIADLALRNFIEMRDSVADSKFLLRKKIEAHLHAQMPNQWIPLYSMVTFSDLPYAEALRIGKQQDQVMEQVMAMEGIDTRWQSVDWAQHPALQVFFRQQKEEETR